MGRYARSWMLATLVAFAFGGFVAGGATAQTNPPAGGVAPAAAGPTDAQIAHIAYTAGLQDIANARQALRKSHNKAVRAFANEMVRDHTAVNKKALALVKKLHVKPEDNPTSQNIAKTEGEKRAEMAKLKGKEFDKAYADNEVAYHKLVNGALQNTLIPNAKNPELKSLLETGHKTFEGHQQSAEELVGKVGG